MKAITKTAFFFMAMIALTTACSKKSESTETTTETDIDALVAGLEEALA